MPLHKAHAGGLGLVVVGDELGAGQHVAQQVAQHQAARRGHVVIGLGRPRQLAAQQVRRVFFEPAHDAGVKALDTVGAVIGAHQRQALFTELGVARPGLELDDKGRAPRHHREHLGQQGDALVGAAKAHAAQLLQRERVHPPVYAADPVQRVVVKDHHLAVFGQLDIQLDAVARLRRQPERGEAVLRHRLVPRVQPAVRVVAAVKGGGFFR